MPRKFEVYEPDAIDCDQLVRSLAGDFNVVSTVEVRYALDKVAVLARCYRPASPSPAVPVVQALVSRPLKAARSAHVQIYSALLDCWHQLDRGVLGARTPDVTYSWDRRPEVPQRRR